MHHDPVSPIEVEAVAHARGPAVVEQDDGMGIEVPQVVDEIDDTLGGLVHEAGEHVRPVFRLTHH